jgi:hypothetical protein
LRSVVIGILQGLLTNDYIHENNSHEGQKLKSKECSRQSTPRFANAIHDIPIPTFETSSGESFLILTHPAFEAVSTIVGYGEFTTCCAALLIARCGIEAT